jgi:prophage regulatory protein
MNADQFKAMMAAHAIDLKQALYLQTGNPVHAWAAYDASRKLELAIPAWVLDYFDACAQVLITAKHSSAKSIADALGLGTKGGPTVTRQAAIQVRNFAIVERIVHLRERPIRSELKAMAAAHGLKGNGVDPCDRPLLVILDQVAGEYDLDVNQVQAIYYKMIRPGQAPSQPTVEDSPGSPQDVPAKGAHAGCTMQAHADPEQTRILRKPAVLERIGVSGTTLWRLERAGKFPRSIRLSVGAVGWRESDIERWIVEREAASR